MYRAVHRRRTLRFSGVLGWILITYLSLVLLFCLIWLLPNNDKNNYKSYKKYEENFDKKLQATIDSVEKYNTLYNENKISTRQMITQLKNASKDLNYLYDTFTWKKGDEITKELYSVKKQIIIDYAAVYNNRAKAMSKGLFLSQTDEMVYIQSIIDHYKLRDRFQREKFRLPLQ